MNKRIKQGMQSCILLLLMGCSGKENTFFASGRFEATEITVSSEVTGRILSFPFEEGSEIQKEQRVGLIDTTQLFLQQMQWVQQAIATRSKSPQIKKQLAALEEQIRYQENEKKRINRLFKAKAATQKQVDDITSLLEKLKRQRIAQLSQLNKSVHSIDAQSSALDIRIAQLKDLRLKCHLRAPIQGVLLDKYIEVGELALPGKPLFKIADLKHLYLRAYITSAQLSKIKIGEEVTVTADFGGNEHFNYPGKITWIASKNEFTPKSIQTNDSRANLVYAIKVAVINDGKIKIGMSGKITTSKE